MPSTNREWVTNVKQALTTWHRPVALGKNPLAALTIVKKQCQAQNYPLTLDGRAQALRDILRQGIQTLGVPHASPPASDDDPTWLEREWRTYTILTLRFLRGLSRTEVQLRIGLAEGGQYYKEQRRAIAMLATLLQDWEGSPESESDVIAIEYPSGAVSLSDTFYIERQADLDLRQEISRPGRTITITGPRQVGKTSLLIRGLQTARQTYNPRVVYVDLQAVGQASLQSSSHFLQELAAWIVDELDMDGEEVNRAWQSQLGPARKLTKLMTRYVLPALAEPIILALDEVDRLLPAPFHTEIFGLLRSWHNLRSRNPLWEKFSLLMAISTEPYLLIDDWQQSPFNVGLMLYLQDFDDEQVAELNRRYGSPVSAAKLPLLINLLDGHPYLTRVALYTMVKQGLTLDDLVATATDEQGPFISHLRYLHRLLANNLLANNLLANEPAVDKAMAEILASGHCPDDHLRYRLLKAGVIKQDGAAVRCRCHLYRRYLVADG